MPELPEVETIKQGLQKAIVGKKLYHKKIVEVKRKGKMIFLLFENGGALAFHLKLTGQLIFNKVPTRFTRKVFYLDDGTNLLFNDVRRFGWYKMVDNIEAMKEVKALGPEPLAVEQSDFKKLFLKKRKAKIKPLLLNQAFICGVGNIYADEILFKAGILPYRIAGSLKTNEVEKLYSSMQSILKQAIEKQGSSVKDYLTATGKEGGYSAFHRVYQKTGQPCSVCQTPIKRIVLGSRGTHFCSKCQR